MKRRRSTTKGATINVPTAVAGTAEQTVLGQLLLLGESTDLKYNLEDVISSIKDDYFYFRSHKIVFQAIRQLVYKGEYVDLYTLDAFLERLGVSEDIGGIAYLVDLCKCVGSVGHLYAHIKILADAAMRRHLNEILSDKLENSSHDVMKDVSDAISRIELLRESLLGQHKGLVHFSDLKGDWIEQFETNASGDSKGMQLGIKGLDDILAPTGIPNGSLVVIGARPKMGKTQFLANIIVHLLSWQENAVAAFSLEMSSMQLIDRLLAVQPEVSRPNFYSPESDDEVSKKAYQASIAKINTMLKEYGNSQLFISDDANVSIEFVEAECRRLNRKQPISAIVVDYLTLMNKGKAERNDLALAEITRRLKLLAKELNCVVFLVTQLNRSLEQRQDKRPLPSDSRDTGQIEQDCDLWIGLYRDSFYNQHSEYPSDLFEISVKLNRHGRTGVTYCQDDDGHFIDYKGPFVVNNNAPKTFKKAFNEGKEF